MVSKQRCKPDELKFFWSLVARYELVEKDRNYYYLMEKGFEGEKKLDSLLENLACNCFILNDVLLQQQHSFFQIDTIIITSQKIFLLEVKNYEGVYYIDNGRWYSENDLEIKNPIIQLNRCETLFRQWLHASKFNLPTEAKLIFINPQFTLFEASRSLPIILPTQLNQYLKSISCLSSTLTPFHNKIADHIMAHHEKQSPFTRTHAYSYDKFKKGIICKSCQSFMTLSAKGRIICSNCHDSEDLEETVIRSVEEYKFLFPDEKITVNAIKEWCEIIESDKSIRRILKKYFKQIGVGRFTYYV